MNRVKNEQKEVSLRAGVTAFGTLSSRVLGLVREMVLAALFPRSITDAFLVAWRLPNMFRRLFGEGALSVSFIPLFVEKLEYDQEKAKEMANGVFTLVLSLISIITLLAIIFMEEIVKILVAGNGFSSIEGKTEATVYYARILFVFLMLVVIYAFFMAILNSLGKFALPALAPALMNVCWITGAFLPMEWFSMPGNGLAWSVIIGGIFQFAILIPSLVKKDFLPRFKLRWRWPTEVKKVFILSGPALFGLSILQISTLANIRFASHFPEGSQSWIYWADRLLELPLSLFAVSLGSALLPTLSKFRTQGDFSSMNETLGYYVRLTLLLAIPSALILLILGVPVVEILLKRGRFGVEDVIQTSAILRVYSLTLVVASLLRVLVTPFYASKNTWFPACASLVGLVSHLLLAPHLMNWLELPGLALSTALSGFINLSVLMLLSRNYIHQNFWSLFFKSLFPLTLASIVMGTTLFLFFPIINFVGTQIYFKIVTLLFVCALSGTLFVLVLKPFQFQELDDLINMLYRKLLFKKRMSNPQTHQR